MCHAGPLCNQFLIELNPSLLPLAPYQQIVAFPPLIGKLDIKTKLPVMDRLIIYLAYIIPPGGNMFELNRLVLPVLHPEGGAAFRRPADGPSVQCDGVFPDATTSILYFMLLHRLYLLRRLF